MQKKHCYIVQGREIAMIGANLDTSKMLDVFSFGKFDHFFEILCLKICSSSFAETRPIAPMSVNSVRPNAGIVFGRPCATSWPVAPPVGSYAARAAERPKPLRGRPACRAGRRAPEGSRRVLDGCTEHDHLACVGNIVFQKYNEISEMMRSVRYYVVGQADMSLADRFTWVVSASRAKTVKELKSDLHGEPFVPKHFAVMVEASDGALIGWATERGLQGRELPSGALDVRIIPQNVVAQVEPHPTCC